MKIGIIYSFGIVYLIIQPGVQNNWNSFDIFFKGLVLGLISYAAYDLTNQATIKGWPTIVTIVDILWGSILTSIVSIISFKVLMMTK